MARCGDCQLWKFEDLGFPADEDDLGECTAMDGIVLPHTWRWCTREIMSAERGVEHDCKRFVPNGGR